MNKANAIKMVLDLRRTADSYESANCTSCVRNGLLVVNPGCVICSGTGKAPANEAAATYRAKAALIMRNAGLTEADLTTTIVNGVVYGNQTRTPADPTVANPDAYNYCTQCGVRGRSYCSSCQPSTDRFAAFFENRERWRYHCTFCHQTVTAARQSAGYRTDHFTGNRPADEPKEKRGRGRNAKSYQADPGKYWYEVGYRTGKAGWDRNSYRFMRAEEEAVAAGYGRRFDSGYNKGWEKAF